MIPFTDREIQKAWRDNKKAYCVTKCTNAHRLLLFYAVECGLKAVLMKRQRQNRTDLCPDITICSHNINKLLNCLNAGSGLNLPEQLSLKPISQSEERKFTPGEINQMWRYGGCSESIKDDDLEKYLLKISQWIEQELKGI